MIRQLLIGKPIPMASDNLDSLGGTETGTEAKMGFRDGINIYMETTLPGVQ